MVASIKHPNICDVYACGTLAHGGPYIVMERLVGDTLAAQIRGARRRPLAPLIDIFVQVLSGLQAAHSAQILHRDLKPQNVFLADRVGCGPLVKIVDFGLARDLSMASSRRITKPGRLCGTLQYMSPEQLRGEALDQRSDLFSVGVLLYELLTGHHPFAAPTEVELQTDILSADPSPLRAHRQDVPQAIEDVVLWAMARSPGARPASATDLQRGLLAAIKSSLHLQLERAIDTEADPVSVTNPMMWIPPTSSPAA